jgi:serine phosphatase RsbU (regulator of sigma subunit)
VELAMALQRQIFPADRLEVPGLRTAARYTSARHGLDIGGDWYDVFAMPDGSIGLTIGDMQGHDAEAAAFMGQVRTGLRAAARVTTDPGEVLGRVSDLLLSMGSGLFTTCSFLRYDPATQTLTGSRAGHVLAVWATADGRFGIALHSGGVPLGVLPGETYPVTRHRLTKTGAYVLLTDGVVEGPSFPIEAGLECVVRLACSGCAADPDDLAAEVIKVAELTGHKDDAAVLVLRHDGAPSPP